MSPPEPLDVPLQPVDGHEPTGPDVHALELLVGQEQVERAPPDPEPLGRLDRAEEQLAGLHRFGAGHADVLSIVSAAGRLSMSRACRVIPLPRR